MTMWRIGFNTSYAGGQFADERQHLGDQSGRGWPAASSPSASVCTIAEPTTAASARPATAATWAAVRSPKPTATGRSVWRRSRTTASAMACRLAEAVPVMPVIET